MQQSSLVRSCADMFRFSVDEAVRSGDIRRASVVEVEAPVVSVSEQAHAPSRAHIVAQRTMS